MNKITQMIATGLILLGSVAVAEGDTAKGEKDFKKCKACHTITNGDDVIFKGGKTGPNLYGIVGRQAGSFAGYKYGKSIVDAGNAGLVWTEELLVEYIQDPKGFLKKTLDDSSAKAKMTFKMKEPDNVVAYLAGVSQ